MTPDLDQAICRIWHQEHRWIWLQGAKAACTDPQPSEELDLLSDIAIDVDYVLRLERMDRIRRKTCTTKL